MNPQFEHESRQLRQANADARALLGDTGAQLRAMLQDEFMMEHVPMEVEAVMDSAAGAIEAAVRRLESAAPAKASAAARIPGGPTRQQGQFLAFIREYLMRNRSGAAPSHADFQRFFNLSPPSVNSMLIRLEQRGFIRRVPHQARAIALTVDPDWIPPLAQPFRF